MKKGLVLVLALAMVLSVVSIASAATTTVGGQLRVWYLNTDNEKATSGSQEDDTFKFDRVAIDVKTAYDDGSSLFVQFQGRNIDKSGGDNVDFFVDQAFWTKPILDGGKLMIGAFDGQVPFKNGYSNVIISGGLGDGLKIGNSVGVAYQYNQDLFGFGLAVVNAELGKAKNPVFGDSVDDEGYAWSTRFDYKPIAGLKAGIGYADLNENDETRLVVDASYKNLDVTPISGMVEYAKVEEDNADDLDAYYVEVGYTFGKAVVYAGYGDGDIYGKKITSSQGTFKINDDNYTVAGLIYQVGDNAFLQGEYTRTDSDNDGFGLRLRVNF